MSQPNKYVLLPQEAHKSQERPNADDVIEDDIPLQDLAEIDNLDFESGLQQEPDLESLPENQEGSGTSNMKMAFMNMANSILGAGIIGQPFAFKNSGVLGGTLVMFFLTGLIDWTLRLIVVNAQLSQTRSYQDTVFYCYGKWGKILLLFSISSFAYGGCMAFCVIIGDTIPHVLKSALPDSWTDPLTSIVGWMFGRNVIITIFTACISYPLSLNRDISKLAKASGFALLGMIIIVIVTVARGPLVDDSLKSSLSKGQWFISFNIFQGISVISFALVCHHNTIFIYNSLKNATVSKFAKLTHWACGISMCFCLLMGLSGLLNFGDKTKGNILNNFKSDDTWINLARFCFGLNMLTTFPLELFVVRDVLKDIVLASKVDPDSDGSTAHLELSKKQHFIITTVLCFSSMGVALLTCNLGMILELIGATSASLMAYIIPPLCYLKLSYDRLDFKNADKKERIKFYLKKCSPSIACTIFGFAVMIISSIMTIRTGLSNEDGGSHCDVA
ncbi:hypothetical protein C7M61_000624 [Candidozyma pseudohaemuli]|uniref:Amino acid transporter transmembrane domain-containing protein n=1 Tax=Candidozyma pseudohaemuli TaxID=418784 RepID=A0A2P7YYB1_9ASCO|nr:hypothetical protein C7M61_000624 [[Candida] pseudohaemulonii]PSK40957.1 hypothetical protein C7M61_000624 [[Candida] pseudohaemulonii]